MAKKEPQTPKEPKPETPRGTREEGEPETPPPDAALSPGEKAELEEYKKIKKETGFTKFSESAKEAIRLAKDNKILTEKLEESSATLSEEDLKKLNPDYEDMTDDEKKDFRAKVAMQKRMAILEAKEKMRNDYAALPEEMRKKIEAKGTFEQFRDYACSLENAGQKSLLNIAKAYLFKEGPEEPSTPEEPETPRVGLEPEGGGPSAPEPKKEGEMTAEEAKALRETDPKEYNRLVKEKKLKIITPGKE